MRSGGFDCRHRRYPFDAGPAQQLQQQGLSLVVGMMGQRDVVAGLPGESGVAQFTRSRLDAVLVTQRCDVDALDMQRDALAGAKIGAEIRPRIGVRADAVMDMQSGKPPLETRSEDMQQMQQNDGIHTAAQTDEDVTVPGKKRREVRRNGFS